MDSSILIFDTPRQAAEACRDRILESLDEARRSRGSATLAQIFTTSRVKSFPVGAGKLPVFSASLFPGESMIGDRTGIAAAHVAKMRL